MVNSPFAGDNCDPVLPLAVDRVEIADAERLDA